MVKRDNILDKAIEKFGELQLVKASEECCELAQALNKYYCMKQTKSASAFNGIKNKYHRRNSRCRDNAITSKKILEIKEEDLEEIKKQKLERLEKALENVYEEN